MVSQLEDAPAVEADQVPTEEPQTEIPETPTELVGDAAGADEEAAAEPEQLEPEPEARRYTAAELREETERVARETAAQTLEWDRRNRQSENARRETERTRREQAAARMAESAETVLLKHGISPDQEVISDLITRFGNARSEVDLQTSQSDIDLAMQYVTAPVLGDTRNPDDWNLTPGADAYARTVLPHLKRVIDTIIPSVQQSMMGDYVAKSEIPKLVEAEIAKRNAKAREGKTNITRVEGANSTVDRSHQATIDRVARGQGDEQDTKYAADYVARIRSK